MRDASWDSSSSSLHRRFVRGVPMLRRSTRETNHNDERRRNVAGLSGCLETAGFSLDPPRTDHEQCVRLVLTTMLTGVEVQPRGLETAGQTGAILPTFVPVIRLM